MQSLTTVLEDMFQVTRAVPAARGALGLSAILKLWRREREDCRVALPAAVCHEVVLAVLDAGCQPVFCDVSVEDGLVPEEEWARARKSGAIVAIVVHLYGNPAETKAVRALFPGPNCLVIDDAAQALGSRNETGLCGAGGDVGLLSFGATKHITGGGAMLLFRDERFASEVKALLATFEPQPQSVRTHLAVAFRSRLEQARARSRLEADRAAGDFAGLLEGMAPVLYVPRSTDFDDKVSRGLQGYAAEMQSRVSKAHAWSAGLAGSELVAVGMGESSVPWRFVCRWPGANWNTQHQLAEALRRGGMHVSNWYLPAHWFLGAAPGTLPGVEQLAREVFQFWVDAEVPVESIARQVALVRREIAEAGRQAIGA